MISHSVGSKYTIAVVVIVVVGSKYTIAVVVVVVVVVIISLK